MIYQVLTVTTVIINIYLSVHALRRRKVKRAFLYLLLMLFMSVYAFGFFFEYLFQDTKIVFCGRNFCQIGYSFSLSTLLVLVLDYNGRINYLRPINLALIYSLPSIGIILKWTDKYHHLMRKDVFWAKGQLIAVSTPFSAGLMFLEYMMVIIVVLMLIEFNQKANPHVRTQLIGILAGIMIPLAVETIKPIRSELIQVIPLMPVLLTLTVIIFGSIFRLQLFSIVPVAQGRIMERIQEGIIIFDNFGRVIDKNFAVDDFVEGIGESRDIIGESADSLLSVWPQWLSACKSMQADEFQIDTLYWGVKRYYRVKVYPLQEKNSKVCGTVSILSEITENKIHEELLNSKTELGQKTLKDLAGELTILEKQLETILENMSEHCVVLNKSGEYLKINKVHQKLFPFIQKAQEEDSLKEAKYFDFQGNEINAGSLPAAKVLKGEMLTNYKLLHKNGDREIYFNINGMPVYDEKGKFMFGIIISHDITDLVLQEKEIILQNKQLETIIKVLPDIGILTISDQAGNYVRNSKIVNRNSFEDTFKAQADFTNKKGVFFHNDGREMDYFEMPELRVLRGQEVDNFHFIIKNRENERHYLFNGSPIYDQSGNLIYGVFFTLDITEQVLHQRLIPVTEQLEALNALKDKLFTVVTHDIRNPMATMVSLIELLEGEKENYSSESIEIIEAVKEQVNNIYTIVENLLEWLKSQQKGLVFNPLVWDLSWIVQEVTNSYQINAVTKGINITSGIIEGTNVFADKDILELVLRNLLSNAIKFTGNGGIISIQAFESGHEVIVAIQDNGIGISHAKAKTLFREAYVNSTRGTAGEKGIGLGLLMCKEFVTRNGGEIWVDSTLGKGSTFRFSLLNPDKMNMQKLN